MIGISVIMPSYLGEYPGSRKDPEKKFIRAVSTFLDNSLNEKELVIVSDGCNVTNAIYSKLWKDNKHVRLIASEKMEATWPGELREVGRSVAKYDWITYLDTDDMYTIQHLDQVKKAILGKKEETTVLFNTICLIPMPENPNELMLRIIGTDLKNYHDVRDQCPTLFGHKMVGSHSKAHSGTWQIVHHKYVPHRWKNNEEMGEDALFIQSLKTTEKWEEFKGGFIHAHNTYNRQDIWEI